MKTHLLMADDGSRRLSLISIFASRRFIDVHIPRVSLHCGVGAVFLGDHFCAILININSLKFQNVNSPKPIKRPPVFSHTPFPMEAEGESLKRGQISETAEKSNILFNRSYAVCTSY